MVSNMVNMAAYHMHELDRVMVMQCIDTITRPLMCQTHLHLLGESCEGPPRAVLVRHGREDLVGEVEVIDMHHERKARLGEVPRRTVHVVQAVNVPAQDTPCQYCREKKQVLRG